MIQLSQWSYPLVILVSLLRLSRGDVLTKSNNAESRLRQHLFADYNSDVLPRVNSSALRVHFGIYLVHVRELSEREGRLTIESQVSMIWNDFRLTWNPQDFGNTKILHMSGHSTWKPDIRLFNSVQMSGIDPLMSPSWWVVHSNGIVDWSLPATFHSICEVDLKFYPYDSQVCKLKFASWVHSGRHLDLVLSDGSCSSPPTSPCLLQSRLSEVSNSEWDLVETSVARNEVYHSCCPEPYPDITVELRLRRKAPYYKYTTLYPALAVIFLTLATFWLPPSASEKLTIGLVNLLILVILLVHLSWKLPPTGRSVPMIAWFCGHSVIVVTVSVILSLIFIMWSRGRHTKGPPRWMKGLLHSWVARILCVGVIAQPHPATNNFHRDPSTLDMEADDIHSTAEEANQQAWIQCVTLFDRINFFIFVIIFSFVLAGAVN